MNGDGSIEAPAAGAEGARRSTGTGFAPPKMRLEPESTINQRQQNGQEQVDVGNGVQGEAALLARVTLRTVPFPLERFSQVCLGDDAAILSEPRPGISGRPGRLATTTATEACDLCMIR